MDRTVRRHVLPLWILIIHWLLERPWPVFGPKQVAYEIRVLTNTRDRFPLAITPWERAMRRTALNWVEKRLKLLQELQETGVAYINFQEIRARRALANAQRDAEEWEKRNDPES